MRQFRCFVVFVWTLGISLLSGVILVEDTLAREGRTDTTKVSICHVPPGNLNTFHTIRTDFDGLTDHLGHNDPQQSLGIGCEGSCRELYFNDHLLPLEPAGIACFGDTGAINLSEAITADFTTDFDPDDPRAPAGVFTIHATFSNISADDLSNIFFELDVLENGNVLLNADGGTTILGPAILGPGERFTIDFEIGLQNESPFRFFVDAFGTPQ